MYSFLIVFQIINCMAMFVVCFYCVKHWSSKAHAYFFVSALAIAVNNFGYLFEMLGHDSETALIGTIVAYVGKPFIGLCMFIFTLYFCNVKIPQWIKIILYLFDISIVVLVCTSDMHNLFYTTREYVYTGLFPHNVYGHGPFYYVYMASNIVYQIIVWIVICTKYKKVKTTKEKRQIIGLLLMSFVVIGGLLIFFTGKTGGYDTTSPAYVICAFIFCISMVKNNLFEDVELVRQNMIDGLEEGILAVEGKNKEIFYYNNMMTVFFPEIQDTSIRTISDLNENPFENEKHFFHGGQVYELSKQPLYQGKKNIGEIYLFKDVTESYHENLSLISEVTNKERDIVNIQQSVIMGLADVVEARDGNTGAHIKNTKDYVKIIVDALVDDPKYKNIVSREYAQMVIEASPLHDIGKITVPDSILGKPGKLEPEEFEIVKKHTIDGATIIDQTLSSIESSDYLEIARDIALYHHEKWNGKGYPKGLCAEEIPLSARIMAVADVYDALVSKRCYKEAFPHEKAKEIMIEGKNEHFDSYLVDIFLENLDKEEKINE